MTAAYQALALNADFQPVTAFPLSIWSFEKTLRKVITDKVMILETHDVVLRSPKFEYRPPSVVVLKNYVKRADGVKFNRMNLFIRDDFSCQYCGSKLPPRDLTFDHVVPRASGGRTSWENIVAACVGCNSRKGSSRHMKPRTAPKKPTLHEMARRAPVDVSRLHRNSLDYLYWSGTLEAD